MNELEKALKELDIEYKKEDNYYKLPTNQNNLKKLLSYSLQMQRDLQHRIDKAIFYMKDGMINEPFTMYKVDQIDVRKLLQILQGEDNE